jgi:hypothetical protein
MAEQFNTPNWFQTVTVYAPGSRVAIEQFEIAQVWDGSLAGHRRLRRASVETVEGLRDKTKLEYIMWSPVLHGGIRVPLKDRQHINIG